MAKLALGYKYKYTGFHYEIGGWKSYYQFMYEDGTFSDWVQHDIIHTGRHEAEEFCKKEQEDFMHKLRDRLFG